MVAHKEFIYWVTERERIRRVKESGAPKPWSLDPVFQSVYFCNTDREHDKVTAWLRKAWGDGPLEHSAANFMMARFVNKPESLAEMGWPWDEFMPITWKVVMSKKGAWGGAYIVSTNGRAMPKHDYIAGLLEHAFKQFAGWPNPTLPPTLRVAHTHLQGAPGIGSFMAAQIIADLKNTTGHPFANAVDWQDFAAHGPGSLRGLSWFHDYKVTPKTFKESLVSARQIVHTIDSGVVAHLCNQNLQNCFCEFDKYMRVKNGTGRSKRKYPGRV